MFPPRSLFAIAARQIRQSAQSRVHRLVYAATKDGRTTPLGSGSSANPLWARSLSVLSTAAHLTPARRNLVRLVDDAPSHICPCRGARYRSGPQGLRGG